MKANNTAMTVLVCSLALQFYTTVWAAPTLDQDEEPVENSLVARPDSEQLSGPWDAINTAALRKILMQLDAEDRMVRGTRSWPQPEPRGWGLRNFDGRIARQWRADKRQVRFRQCYFNPISCFKK